MTSIPPLPSPWRAPVASSGGWSVHHGDCLAWLRSLPDDSIDSVVTDPPYGLGRPPPIRDVMRAWLDGEQYQASGGGFMGRDWDSFVPGPVVWSEVYRVLKPGGHAVVFAGQRTADVMALALRMGGFEIRDLIGWCYWSGFPKSLDVSKALDSLHGAEREVVGSKITGNSRTGAAPRRPGGWAGGQIHVDITAPATDDAKRWAGFGTALKPAIEPAWLVRKPISESSIARNVLRWGTGAINIDGCRFAYGDRAWVGPNDGSPGGWAGDAGGLNGAVYGSYSGDGGARPVDGRWPANLYHCPKASTAEREAGCDDLPMWSAGELVSRTEGSAGMDNPRAGAGRTSSGRRNLHPTVKPVELMRWLCRLVTPPGGTVIDPYTGSGTTGIAAVVEGCGFRGAEINNSDGPPPQRFVDIATARIDWWERHGVDAVEVWRASSAATEEREQLEAAGQVSLFGGGEAPEQRPIASRRHLNRWSGIVQYD